TLIINGSIDQTGKGFLGGAGSHRCACQAFPGGSYDSFSTSCCTTGCSVGPNGGGGGNGGTYALGTAGGSGAGYGTAGTPGVQGTNESGQPYGSPDLSTIYLGSGGGGAYEDTANCTGVGGAGGPGGGIVLISALTVSLAGGLIANGGAGVDVPVSP